MKYLRVKHEVALKILFSRLGLGSGTVEDIIDFIKEAVCQEEE